MPLNIVVVDMYDALTSTRVYRKAMLHSAAHESITKERGKHFDPVIVDAYLSREAEFRSTQATMGG